MNAPIALFVYNRPEHSRKTIESLISCPEFAESPIYVFSDGSKNTADAIMVAKTLNVVTSLIGHKATIVIADQNRGLAESIIFGVSRLLQNYDRVIVMEDDLIVNNYFLQYMNAALEFYKNDEKVMQISGYMYPIRKLEKYSSSIFLPFSSSWGWATWRSSWEYFDPKASGWEVLLTDIDMRSRFNIDQSYDYFDMLKNQMSGSNNIDSWAIRWYWSIFKNSGYILYPQISYVENIGFDNTGTHCSVSDNRFKKITHLEQPALIRFPVSIEMDLNVLNLVKQNFQKQNFWFWLFKKLPISVKNRLILMLKFKVYKSR
jgi:hypothetical protein